MVNNLQTREREDLIDQVLLPILNRLLAGHTVELQMAANDVDAKEAGWSSSEMQKLAIEELMRVLPADFKKLVKVI